MSGLDDESYRWHRRCLFAVTLTVVAVLLVLWFQG
jgi:hypothetical protein